MTRRAKREVKESEARWGSPALAMSLWTLRRASLVQPMFTKTPYLPNRRLSPLRSLRTTLRRFGDPDPGLSDSALRPSGWFLLVTMPSTLEPTRSFSMGIPAGGRSDQSLSRDCRLRDLMEPHDEYLGAAELLASSFARPSSARRPAGAGDAERAFAVADFALSHLSPVLFIHRTVPVSSYIQNSLCCDSLH